METLTRLPWIGPAAAWFCRTRAWRVFHHLDARAWTRLAAATTFTSFLALFPVIALTAAVCAALLPEERRADVERWFADQVPGISGELQLHALFANATAIGLVSLLLLLPTGLSWVDTLRAGQRALWDLPEPAENVLVRKVKDVGVLAGLGAVALVSLGASALAVSAVHWAGSWLGLARDGLGRALVQLAVHAVAVAVTALLLAYVLVWLPGVRPPRRATVAACLLGAVGFEVLKLLLSGYLTGVAAKSVYGAFGVPIALLIWINLLAKLLLACCAWTATAVTPGARPAAEAWDVAGGAAGDAGGRRTPPPPPGPGERP